MVEQSEDLGGEPWPNLGRFLCHRAVALPRSGYKGAGGSPVTNNDILRRLRFALDQSDAQVLELLRSVGHKLSPHALPFYLLREDDPNVVLCPDDTLRAFLDGLILARRGPRDPGSSAAPEGPMSNNLILRKLKIALDLKEADMLAILKLGGMELSSSELAALFRARSHRHFRPCGDQLLRNFLGGLTLYRRGV